MLFPEPGTKVSPEGVAVTDPDEIAAADGAGPSAAAIEVESLLRKGQLKEAENAILAVLQQPDKTWEHYAVLGQVYSAQERVHEAREAYQHAVLVAPSYARPHFRFGEFLLRRGELREAEEELRTAIRISPNISDFHASLGAVLLEQGWIKEAHSSLRRAIRLDRKSSQPREVLGKLLAAKGNYRGAEKAFAKAHALDPDSRSMLENLAKVFEERGKTDKAIACTNKILALDPSDDLTATHRDSATDPRKESADPDVPRKLPAVPRSLFEKFRMFWAREKKRLCKIGARSSSRAAPPGDASRAPRGSQPDDG